MKKKNHTIFLTAAMILALGVPPVTGQAAVPTTDNESHLRKLYLHMKLLEISNLCSQLRVIKLNYP